MILFRTTILVAALVGATSSAAAQAFGLPIVTSGGASGFSVGGEYAKANADAGDRRTIGAHASLGLGLIAVRAMVSHSTVGDETIWSTGGTATVQVMGGPFIPFRVLLQGGVGRWEIGDAEMTRVPVAIGFGATIPNPAFAIKPWVAPRVEVVRMRVGGYTGTDTEFGISGGIDLTLLNGVTLRGAYDRIFREGLKPAILSFGISLTP